MGDGRVRKIAILLNGSDERGLGRGMDQVEITSATLARRGYELFIASPEDSNVKIDAKMHVAPTEAGVERIADALENADDDDEFVIIMGGHGGIGKNENGCLQLPKTCLENDSPALKKLFSLPHGRRTVLVNICSSGNWLRNFAGDPKTLFISSTSRFDPVSRVDDDLIPGMFAVDIPDRNSDKTISWSEMFAEAMASRIGIGSVPVFITGHDYIDRGLDDSTSSAEPPHYSTAPHRVSSAEEYEKIMAHLKPGDFAVVAVNPSPEYAQKLENLAKKSGGKAFFVSVSGLRSAEHKRIDLPSDAAVYVVDFRGLKTKVSNTDDPLGERAKIYDDVTSQRAYWAERMAFAPEEWEGRLPEKYADDPYFNFDVEGRWANMIAQKMLRKGQATTAAYQDVVKQRWLQNIQEEPSWAWENIPAWLREDPEFEATYRDAMMQHWTKRNASIPSFRVHVLDLSLVRFWNIGAPEHAISSTGIGASLGLSWSPLRFGTEHFSSLGIYAGGVAAISEVEDISPQGITRERRKFTYTALKLGILGETMISDNFFLGAMPYVSETDVNVDEAHWRTEQGQNYESMGSKSIYSGSERAWGIELSLRYFKLRETRSLNLGLGYERIGSLRDGGNMVRVSIGPHLSF